MRRLRSLFSLIALLLFVAACSTADNPEDVALVSDIVSHIKADGYHQPIDLDACHAISPNAFVPARIISADRYDTDGDPCSLDPYSAYLSKKQARFLKQAANGLAFGLGIEVAADAKGEIIVARVAAFSSGAITGIITGDIIRSVRRLGSYATIDVRTPEQFKRLTRCDSGVSYVLTFEHRGVVDTRTFICSLVSGTSVTSKALAAEHAGYLKITSFTVTTARDVALALERFRAPDGTGNAIIDLRGNGGGLVSAALGMLCLFSDDPSAIMIGEITNSGRSVQTIGSSQEENCRLRRGRFKKMSLAILANGMTASASEIVTGTLLDWRSTEGLDVTLIGQRTYGKYVFQSEFPLANGSMLKLTNGEYRVGNMQASVKGGLLPDIRMPTMLKATGPNDPLVDLALQIFADKAKKNREEHSRGI